MAFLSRGSFVRDRDIISSSLCIVVAILFCIGGLEYGLGSFSNPAPGLYPFILGLIFIALSMALLFPSLKKKQDTIKQRFLPPREKAYRLALSLVFLYAYGMAMEPLGYVVTTFFFLVGVLRFVGLQKWWTVLATSFLATLFSFLLFVTLLKSQLPKGPLGI